jgi:hypothetical protein
MALQLESSTHLSAVAPPPASASAPRPEDIPERVAAWPRLSELIVLAGIAALAIAVEIFFSLRVGLLSVRPRMDGLGYMTGSKDIYFKVVSWFGSPRPLSPDTNYTLMHSPLWTGLLSLSYFPFGAGEWQSYVGRFWPVFLFIATVFYILRRRAGSNAAWCSVALTALLPVISPALTVAAAHRPWSSVGAWEGFPADLRPDFFCAVLFAATAALLFENIHHLDRRSVLASGTLEGFAILCKPSTSPAILCSYFLALLYVIFVNRRDGRKAAKYVALTLLPVAVLAGVYAVSGGYAHVRWYLHFALVTTISDWSSHTSALENLVLYWKRFGWFMGKLGWLALALATITLAFSIYRRKKQDAAVWGYLLLAAAWYSVITATPAKNAYLGIFYYLLVWIFALAALAPVLVALREQYRWLLPAIAVVPIAAVSWSAVRYIRHIPPSEQYKVADRATLQQAARDLEAVLRPGESYTAGDWYAYTGYALYYDTVGRQPGLFPVNWEPSTPLEQIPEFLRDRVEKTRVVFVYKEDMSEIGGTYEFFCAPPSWPYYRALKSWVNAPEHGYKLYREYPIVFPGKTFTLQMFLRP